MESKLLVGDLCIPTDEDGFIQEPELWSEAVARELAKTEGIEAMTEDHWRVVNFLRGYWLRFGVAPLVRKLLRETGFDLRRVYDLFPSGPAKGACKIAGLPKPVGCV